MTCLWVGLRHAARGRIVKAGWIAIALFSGAVAMAAPNEIKVFTDELARPGEHTLETHVNRASSRSRAEEPLRVMPEYSYGMHPNCEFSLQLPIAFTGSTTRLEGYRAEVQYIARHDQQHGLYWGFNVELARINRLAEDALWNVEFIPIFGYRTERWHFVANPGFDKSVSGASGAVNFEPSAKVAYRAFGRNYYGLEYYVDAGLLRHRLPGNEQDRVLYLAWDGRLGKSDINFGVGRGITDASDRWVVKAICEIAF